MKDIVSDIVDILRQAYRNENIMKEENVVLKGENEALRIENALLKERLEHYEKPQLDSKNSNIPPSRESLKAQAIRRTRSLRVSSGKKPGGQVGHTGNTLLKSEKPDEVQTHNPIHCAQCGNSLQEIDGLAYEIRQSIDIPLPIRPKVTDHIGIEKRCTCGHCNRADFPSHVKPGVSYGVNIHALVAYLSTAQHIPFKRLVEVLNDFYGLQMSQGSVSNILNRMRKQGLIKYNEIKQEIQSSPVVGADETGMRLNKNLYWMWVFQNELSTFVFPHSSRGKAAIDSEFSDGLPNSLLVTDCHSSYFNMKTAGHQICLAHLLRKLIYLTVLDEKQDWSVRMLALLKESIHLQKSDNYSVSGIADIKERYKKLMEEDISHLWHDFREFRNGLSPHSEHLFVFLENLHVPPDNNASERSIRPLKVKQKVSGQFKSGEGASAFCVLHSIINTARKKKQDPFLTLIDIAKNVISYQS